MIENENTWARAVQNNATDEFHKKFDQAIESLKKELGKTYPLIIGGKEIQSDKLFEVKSPSDTRIILAKFPLNKRADAKRNQISKKRILRMGLKSVPAPGRTVQRNSKPVFCTKV